MLPPIWTFTFGLILLILFGWYFATDLGDRKRNLGTVLTVLLLAFCIDSMYPPSKKIGLGLDLQGGTEFLLRLSAEGKTITPAMLDQAVGVIDKRVNKYGNGEPIITPQGTDRILVQIPGLDAEKIQEARTQLERVARLEFKLVYPNTAQKIAEIDTGTSFIPAGYAIQDYKEVREGKPVTMRILVKKKAEMGGEHVTEAHAAYGSQGNEIVFQLDNEGADEFGRLTAAHVGDQMAIVLDGVVESAPVIQGAIYGGTVTITGHFSDLEAQNLASVLENPLQTPVKIDETRSTSATLGSDSIRSGIYAGVAGLLLVAIFMIVYYRLVGFIAIVALVINCVMVVGAIAIFNGVLTLPGIAGLVLSLGIAIDANVLIYERLREELDSGKSLKTAVESSYGKAFSAIFDAHVTQFLTAAILFWLANGPIKGFALTLTIGIVASMFSSLLITRTCFSWAFAANMLNKVTMLHLIRSKSIDFVGNAKRFVVISTVLVAISIGILAMRGEKNLGADFRGGDLLVLSAKQKLTPDQVRAALAGTRFQNSTIQEERMTGRDMISIRSDYGSAEEIKERLSQALSSAGLNFEMTDHVGPLVGRELASKSAVALLLGLAGIFVFVSLRFETSFAIGSIVALAHDLIITLGIFALSGRELSLIMVGAILSIAGYSINDKIVVFDRIRSGLRDRHGGNTVAEIMNTSINETLSRTILTGGTALLTVLALYFFGGPVLNDFAFSFVIGIVVGTYSSIFIAAPIVLWSSGRKGFGKSGALPKSEIRRSQTAAA